MTTTWSKYQQAVFDWHDNSFLDGKGRAVSVRSGAGSGKTTTLVEAGKSHIPPTLKDALSLAFNSDIAKVLKAKYEGTNIDARTYNSFGVQTLLRCSNSQKVVLDQDKTKKIFENLYDRYTYGYNFPAVKQLVSLIKANLVDWNDNSAVLDLAMEYGIELNGDAQFILSAVSKVMQEGTNNTKWIDFDDQIFLPLLYDMPIKKYDYIQCDELQDTNLMQKEMIFRACKDNTVFAGVGDPNQAIYGWRGAGIFSMQEVEQKFGAEVLHLPITYRNSIAVVELVRQTFPDIPIEYPDWAEQGEVTYLPFNKFATEVHDNDMILCRNNAPLVKPCYALIRQGKKAIIKGRDIGSGLNTLINKMKANSLQDLYTRLGDYERLEVSKLLASDKNVQAQAVEDKVETILALGDGCTTLDDLKNRISTVFSDDNAPITFSTVHRSKGLEAERVFVLQPELLNGKRAKREKEVIGEKNIKYVCFTRAKRQLTFVEGY